MHHKRGRARRTRAGCKMCKPWKMNGVRTEREGGEKFSDHARRIAAMTAEDLFNRTMRRYPLTMARLAE